MIDKINNIKNFNNKMDKAGMSEDVKNLFRKHYLDLLYNSDKPVTLAK